ncbi:unnamed protein product [Trichobilharzia szidati]|nr:unnamed protein product [Trichobilharzia szidati]
MFQCLPFLSEQEASFSSRKHYGSKAFTETYRPRYEISSAEISETIRGNSIKSTQSCSSNITHAVLPMLAIHNNGSLKGCSITPSFFEFLKDCLHLSLRCLKAILNNQKGCKRAMEHPLVISLLTFCLFHPNYSTKTLTLDMLTALCLIEGGHVKVLQSFDRLRVVMGEGLRFELLLAAFRYHETLDEENYSMDFAVTCVQFLNIVVHSPENINLRVYLQYELHLLGFDDLLKQIRDRSGSRLKVQIEAYLDNRVDCSLLLEDAEAKEAALLEQERLEKALQLEINTVKRNEANFKHKENELLRIVESLRIKKREYESVVADRESAMRKQINELRLTLQSAQMEINELKQNLHITQTVTTATTKSFNSMSTSTHFETYKLGNLDNNANNNNNLVSLAQTNTIEHTPSTEPTLITRSISIENDLCNNNNNISHEGDDGDRRSSPSGSEASLDQSSNNTNNNKQDNLNGQINVNSISHTKSNVIDCTKNDPYDEPPMKPQRRAVIAQKSKNNNTLFSPCTPQNLTTTKQLANQAANYLSELIKLVSSLVQESRPRESISEDLFSNNNTVTAIYPVGWESTYHPMNVTISGEADIHDIDVDKDKIGKDSMQTTTKTIITSVETIFNDHIFRTCYLANISMKSEGICTNSEDFFNTYSSQLPELWLTALKKYKYSQNVFNKKEISSNSLNKFSTHDTKRSKLVSDLHNLGLLSSCVNEATDGEKHIHVNDYVNDVDDIGESIISKSKLVHYLLHICLDPVITQHLLNELHHISQHLFDNNINNPNCNQTNNNTSFTVMNSLTIELFNHIERALQKYFNRFNTKLPTCTTADVIHTYYDYEVQRWPYLISLLQANLVKFTLIDELKLINENLSVILECCTSLLVSTKLPLIMQLICHCMKMLLNDTKSTGFQLKSLDSLIDWHLTSPQMSNNENESQPQKQQGQHLESQNSTAEGQFNNEKSTRYIKVNFMPIFVKFINNISPNLLTWPSELNQLEIVSRIKISHLFKRIEYVKSSLNFLLNYSKTIENVNSSIGNGGNEEHGKTGISTTTRMKSNILSNEIPVVDHLSQLLIKTSETIWIIVHSTAYWIVSSRYSDTSSSSCNYDGFLVSDEWLNPLVRFTASFKNYVYELERKPRYTSQNSCNATESHSSSHSHRHSQKRSKDQEKASSSSKREHRHRKPRTRQLDTDGLMDDILHNLTLNPLRTDIHIKRSDKTD